MKRYLRYLFFVLLTGLFLLSNANTVFSAFHGTCTLIKSGIISYCGQTGDICGPSSWINGSCNGFGSAQTGDYCCTNVLEPEPGKFYDYCSGTTFPGGLCGPGDATNLLVNWYCCLNPTPTPNF